MHTVCIYLLHKEARTEGEYKRKNIVPGETNRLCHRRLFFPLISISPLAEIEIKIKEIEEPAFREPEGFHLGILLRTRKGQVDVNLQLSEIDFSH